MEGTTTVIPSWCCHQKHPETKKREFDSGRLLRRFSTLNFKCDCYLLHLDWSNIFFNIR